MPFFVFLSGYFTHVNNTSFWKGMLAILESYVVFQLIKGFLQGYSIIDYLTTPAPMMWYLLALLIWRLFAYFINRINNSKTNNVIILALLFLTGLMVGFVDGIGKTFALSRVIVFAPFFWLGYILSGKDFVSVCKKTPWQLALIILILPIILVALLTPSEIINVREVVRGASGYGGSVLGLVARACLYILAFVMSVSLTSILSETKLLSEVGRDSLKYYLFHGILLSVMVFLKLPWNWYFAIVYGALLMTFLYFFNKTKLSDFAIRPISYTIDYIKSRKSNN
jgi:fucose 4-O-acetylase-like acetyltransferase